MANHSHRAGKLKQQNKKNKRANASKRSRTKLQGGKVQGPSSSSGPGGGRKGLKSNDTHGKAKFTRMNAAKQRREANKKNVWNARRGIVASGVDAPTGVAATLSRAVTNAPPRVVGIISLSELEGPLEERVRGSLTGGADKVLTASNSTNNSLLSTVTAAYNMHAKGGQPHITLLTNSTSFRPQYSSKNYGEEDASVQGALDLCRVCDLVLFLIDGSTAVTLSSSALQGSVGGSDAHSLAATSVKTSNTTAHLDHLISERGDRILTAIKAQGLPTPLTVIVHKEENGGVSGTGNSPMENLFAEDSMKNVMRHDQDSDDDDDDDMEDEDDVVASLPGHSMATNRSVKSIRRTYMRKRTELKRYVTRLAATEFGEGTKVTEVDIHENDINASSAGIVKMDDESSMTVASNAATAVTTATSAAARSQTSVAALVRMLCTISASGPNWVADASRPFLITEGTIGGDNSDASKATVRYDESTRELALTGYVRGNAPWNCNQLVHVPHMGTFAVKDVKLAGVSTTDDAEEMLPPIVAAGRKSRRSNKTGDNEMDDADNGSGMAKSGVGGMVLAKPDSEERESLEMFASPDALEGEQNLIGFDDEDGDGDRFGDELDVIQEGDGEKKVEKFSPGTARPAGWSDYQSAWLDALDSNNNEEEEDRGELAFALNKKVKNEDEDMEDEDDEVNAEEKRALLAARKQDRTNDMQFPDEVDHEEETSARDRYARYRALKSFRKSYWDPKENLPDNYGAVYHFSSFKATQRDVLGDVKDLNEVVKRRGWGVGVDQPKDGADVEMEEDSEDEEEEAMARACVPPGAYVTITLENVPPSAYANLSHDAIVTAVSLLPHENKVSVLHMGLSSTSKPEYDTEVPIKSKDVLTFRCGWRTWQSRPVFSQLNLNSDKHKFERYMPNGNGGSTFFAGSVFGPVTYAPCPVLMFREQTGTGTFDSDGNDGKREFLAHGSMLGADADRIVLKRIILTGFPTRVHKRHATVKYMFYNPEDVKWFMPAGITTKHGLQGNIIESVGDHGVMKCLFNAPIKQHDTVCLPLYKRVFPKFAPIAEDEDGEESVGGGGKHLRVL